MKLVICSTQSILVGAALALAPVTSAFGDMQGQLDESSARAFPGDTFQPTTPLRAIPGDTFTPAQLRALQRERIMTAADFLEADRRVLARALGVNSRQAGRMQAEMRGRLYPFDSDQVTPREASAPGRNFPGDSFSGEQSFPGDSFDPATPLRAIPGDTFTPAQLRALQRERIMTAADFLEADRRVLARVLGVNTRQAGRMQAEMRGRLSTNASARGIQPEEGGEDLFAPDQSFPGDSFARQRGFPGDSFSGELSFPGDSFDPATPLRAFPGDSFTPAQLRALQRERIRTAADLAEANPRVVGRALGVSPREAERLQTEMRRRFTQ